MNLVAEKAKTNWRTFVVISIKGRNIEKGGFTNSLKLTSEVT